MNIGLSGWIRKIARRVDLSTLITEPKGGIDLGIPDNVITGFQSRALTIDVSTKGGYAEAKEMVRELVGMRSRITAEHKALKQSALEYGRKCDEAKRLALSKVKEVEEPLKQKLLVVDDAIAEKKRIEAEERAAAERAAQEAADAERRAKEEAERKRIEAEQAAERKRQAEEQAKIDAEREKLLAERRKLEAEREAIEAEKRKQQEAAERIEREKKAEAERIERERLAKIAAEAKAKADEAARVEAEKRKAEQEAEAKRLAEERKPDKQKLLDLVDAIRAVKQPVLSTDWGKQARSDFDYQIASACIELEAIAGTPAACGKN